MITWDYECNIPIRIYRYTTQKLTRLLYATYFMKEEQNDGRME